LWNSIKTDASYLKRFDSSDIHSETVIDKDLIKRLRNFQA